MITALALSLVLAQTKPITTGACNPAVASCLTTTRGAGALATHRGLDVNVLAPKGTATAADSLPVTFASDGVVSTCNGSPGTPVVLTITAGADASSTLTKGVRYLVVNDAGGTVFCKAGGAATAGTDAPYIDQSTRCHMFSSAAEADVVYHCAAAATVTGKVFFIPMIGKGP